MSCWECRQGHPVFVQVMFKYCFLPETVDVRYHFEGSHPYNVASIRVKHLTYYNNFKKKTDQQKKHAKLGHFHKSQKLSLRWQGVKIKGYERSTPPPMLQNISTYPPSHHDAWAKDMHFDDKELFRALRGMISGLGLLVPWSRSLEKNCW